MKNLKIFILLNLAFVISLSGQPKFSYLNLMSENDLEFLKELTKDVMESSRIVPGQKISDEFGPNNTGGTLIRPGGRTCYPAFWIRDYALSLESGFVTSEEQKHMLQLAASTQCDHIRIDDSKPIYFPGTYDFVGQGNRNWGMTPPYCDQFFFIQMAWD